MNVGVVSEGFGSSQNEQDVLEKSFGSRARLDSVRDRRKDVLRTIDGEPAVGEGEEGMDPISSTPFITEAYEYVGTSSVNEPNGNSARPLSPAASPARSFSWTMYEDEVPTFTYAGLLNLAFFIRCPVSI